MAAMGSNLIALPQGAIPDYAAIAQKDLTSIMQTAKMVMQMRAQQQRMALAQARAARGGSVKLTKEERKEAAAREREAKIRDYIDKTPALKNAYGIINDPTKTAKETSDALAVLREHANAIKLSAGTEYEDVYNTFLKTPKLAAERRVKAVNDARSGIGGILSAFGTGLKEGFTVTAPAAGKQLLAIPSSSEEQARIGRETAAQRRELTSQNAYMADVAKGGEADSVIDTASGIGSMVGSIAPALVAAGAGGKLGAMIGGFAGPVGAGVGATAGSLLGAAMYGMGLSRSETAERIASEPGLSEAQQAQAVGEAMPFSTAVGAATSLPIVRPIRGGITALAAKRAAGQAATQAAERAVPFAVRRPFIANTLEAAAEGGIGMGAYTMGQNYAINDALGKPVNLTEGLGESLGAAALMAPIFGAMGARAQRRAMPKPADTAQPEAPTTPTTPTGKPISAVKAMEQVRASLSNDEKLLSTLDGFGSIAGTGDKATLATRLVNTSSLNLEPAERASLVREMIARDDLQHVLLKTPAKEDGTYTEAFKKKLDNAVKAYAEAGGTRDTMDSILSTWDSKLTKLKDIQATAFESYLKDTARYEKFFEGQKSAASADGGTTPGVGPADGQGTKGLTRQLDAADSQRGGTPKANVTEPAAKPAEQITGNTPADESRGDGRTALQSVRPTETLESDASAAGTPATAAEGQSGLDGGVATQSDASASQVTGKPVDTPVGAARNRWNVQTISDSPSADGGSVKTFVMRRVTPRGKLTEWVRTSRVGADGKVLNGDAPRPASGPFKDIADAIQEAYKKDHNGTIPKSGDPMLQRTVEKALDEYDGVTDPVQHGDNFYAISKGGPSIAEQAAGLNLLNRDSPMQVQLADTVAPKPAPDMTPEALATEAETLNAEVAKQNAKAVDVPESQIPDTSVGEAAGDVTDPKIIHC